MAGAEMLTEHQTDLQVSELAVRAASHGWPPHAAEYLRCWLQRGAVIVHVGPQVIAVRTWTGAILRECRMQTPDWPRLANEEFYGLEGEPVVDDAARLIAQTGDGQESVESAGARELCLLHGDAREIGCTTCGLPVIERVGPCGCPSPRPWQNGVPNYRAITGQIDHANWCPGYQPERAVVVEPQRAPTEIVRPKRVKVKPESLTLGGVK